MTPDLLLITHNRIAYLRKTVSKLLADPSDFRLHCWDNGSTDGARDLIAELKDDRIVERHYHPTNANQHEPMHWFLDRVPEGFVGKIDDDVLLPTGWTQRLSEALSASDSFGMLGCWNFMQEDFLPEVAEQNVCEVNGVRVLRTPTIGGCSFLARRELLRSFVEVSAKGWGIPIDRRRMALAGFVCGYPLPLLEAHHMDDPRSVYYQGLDDATHSGSLTARMRGFSSAKAYAGWIRADALRYQVIPIKEQLEQAQRAEFQDSTIGKVLRRLERVLGGGNRACS